MTARHPLDNPVRAALLAPSPHWPNSQAQRCATRPTCRPSSPCPTTPARTSWADLARLVGPGGLAVTAAVPAEPPPGWDVRMNMPGVQLTGSRVIGRADTEAVRLGAADVPDMLSLWPKEPARGRS